MTPAKKLPPDEQLLAGHLRCAVCHRERLVSDAEHARLLADGFPECCGETMAFLLRPRARRR
jgi:hypothetical protein